MTAKITYKREKDVKARVKKLLDAYDFFWWMPSANGFGTPGIADICALHKGGVLVAIETKFGSNKPTEHQKAFLETVNAHNSFGFVVSDKTIDAFEQWLENFDTSVKLASHKKPIPDEVGAATVEAIRVLTEPLMEHKAHKIKDA
jgi:hypothetical protein